MLGLFGTYLAKLVTIAAARGPGMSKKKKLIWQPYKQKYQHGFLQWTGRSLKRG